jgi:hypothetical protein
MVNVKVVVLYKIYDFAVNNFFNKIFYSVKYAI